MLLYLIDFVYQTFKNSKNNYNKKKYLTYTNNNENNIYFVTKNITEIIFNQHENYCTKNVLNEHEYIINF